MKKHTRKPTISDVARLAGVGTATVDRVLNERGNVSDAVRRKVIQVAREIGLNRVLPQTYRPMVRINLILARPELPLLHRMAEEFRALARSLRQTMALHVTTLPDEDPGALARAITHTECDCVVVYAQDNADIRAAIDKLHDKGKPVVTIISDLPNSKRLAYAGTNHHAAGRSAGYFIARMCPGGGAVIILCKHLGFLDHAERVAGLRAYLAEHAPALHIARIVEGQDDRERSRARLETAFRDIPETVAVYNVGAANLGVRAAIESDLLPVRPLFVGFELTTHTAQMLRDGIMTLAIDQNPKLQAQFALNVLMHHFGHDDGPVEPPYRSTVPIILYGPEYLPPGFD